MYIPDIVFFYGRDILLLICMIIYCIIVLRNKNLVPLVESVSKKKARKINIVAKIALGLFWVFMIKESIIPGIKDIPYILENKYEMVTGYAVSVDNAGRDELKIRSFTVEDENHNRVSVIVLAEKVYMGDYMKIAYLPHKQVGSVIERSKQK